MATFDISGNLTLNTARFQQGMTAAKTSVQKFESSVSQVSKKMKKFGGRMQSVGQNATRNLSLPIALAGGAAIKTFSDFEDAMTEVQKVAGEGTGKKLEKDIRSMATEIPIAQSRLAGLTADAARFGIEGTENIRNFTEIVAKMSFATDLATDEAGTSLAKLTTITDASTQEVENLSSSIVSLGNNFATSEKEITEATLKAGAAGTQFGLTSDQVVALSAATNEASESADQAGTRLRRVFQELQEPKKIKKVSDALGLTVDEFKGMKENSPVKLIKNLVEGFRNSETTANGLRETLSTASRQSVAGLAENLEGLNEALKVSSEEFKKAESINREFNLVKETLSSKTTIAINKLRDLGIQLGRALKPTLESTINAVESATKFFSNMSTKMKTVTASTLGLTAAIGPALAGIGFMTKNIAILLPSVSRLTKAFKLLRTAMIANPWGAIAVAAAGLAATIISLSSNTQELTEKQEALRSVNEKAKKSIAQERGELKRLMTIAKSENVSREKRIEAVKELNSIMPESIENITLEGIESGKAAEKVEKHKNALLRKAKAKAVEEEITKRTKKIIELESRSMSEQLGFVDDLKISFGLFSDQLLGTESAYKTLNQAEKERKNKIKAQKKAIEALSEKSIDLKNSTDKLRESEKLSTDVLKKRIALGKNKMSQMLEELKNKQDDTTDSTKKMTAADRAAFRASMKRWKAQKKLKEAQDADIPLNRMDIGEKVEEAKNLKEELANVEIGGEKSENAELFVSEKQKQKFKKRGEEIIATQKRMQRQAQQMNRVMSQAFQSTAVAIGETLGNAFTSAGKEAAGFGQRMLKIMASFTERMGKLIVSFGISMEAFKKAFSSPLVAVAAGTSLIALSQFIKSQAKQGPQLAEGGIVKDEINNATIGEKGPEAVVPLEKMSQFMGKQEVKVTGQFVQKGEDLVATVEKQGKIDRNV